MRFFSSKVSNISRGPIPQLQYNFRPLLSKSSFYNQVETTLRKGNFIGARDSYSDFLQRNKITSPGETPTQMFERVSQALAGAGESFYGVNKAQQYQKIFHDQLTQFKIILSTPLYTNAGRHPDKSLSACAVPPINFKKVDPQKLKALVRSYHVKGMGTGFNFDTADDPVEMLKLLNQFAAAEVHQGIIERPVGNMGILSVDHPRALEFAAVKGTSNIQEWKFNISINLTAPFMEALKNNRHYYTPDNRRVNPQDFLSEVAQYASLTGDPGVVFMHKHSASNKTPHLGEYISVAPCSEVPLLNGEVCQFGYINLHRFTNHGEIDYPNLKNTIHHTVTLLDNALELSIENLPTHESKEIVSKIRKIGIGICGFSDALIKLGIPYDSPEAKQVGENILSFINFESKLASVNLAKIRNPFPAFHDTQTRRELIVGPYLDRETDTVNSAQWEWLNQQVQQHGIRHISTVILPPTGRSSLVGGVSTSIEPPFKLIVDEKLIESLTDHCQKYSYQGDLNKDLESIEKLGTARETNLPDPIKQTLLTCTELSPEAHMQIAAGFQKFTDEAISKTVNLPENTAVEDIVSIYAQAYDLGLKGMSVYVDNSRKFQPKSLSREASNEDTENNPLYFQDIVYGQVVIPSSLQDLLDSATVQRLKSIHQNGIDHLIDPRRSATRFEHSLGTMHLVKLLNGSLEEQIAALLHDISHTSFSHLIDVIFDNKKQNYHEKIRQDFLNQSELKTILTKMGIDFSKIEKDDYFSIVKTKGADLNADRLDYFLRDSVHMNLMSVAEARSIVNNLVVIDHIIHCADEDTAKFIFENFIRLNKDVYFNEKFEDAALLFKLIVQRLFKEGVLNEGDFMGTEDHIIQKIEQSQYRELFSHINNTPTITKTSDNNAYSVTRKLRYIDPRIASQGGKRFTEIHSDAKKQLQEYLNLPSSIYYHKPMLEDFFSKNERSCAIVTP